MKQVIVFLLGCLAASSQVYAAPRYNGFGFPFIPRFHRLQFPSFDDWELTNFYHFELPEFPKIEVGRDNTMSQSSVSGQTVNGHPYHIESIIRVDGDILTHTDRIYKKNTNTFKTLGYTLDLANPDAEPQHFHDKNDVKANEEDEKVHTESNEVDEKVNVESNDVHNNAEAEPENSGVKVDAEPETNDAKVDAEPKTNDKVEAQVL